MEISNQSQSRNIVTESQETKNIEDQSIKETQLIEDINIQENKYKNGKEFLVTEQSNTTKSKKKSKNKKAKVITEQLIGNVSDVSKKEIPIGELEEKRELLAEPKLDHEVKIKLEEATTKDITHNKSTNKKIPAEENKQEDIKQQTTDETTEQKALSRT
ncbi:uncharacterized protein LOC114943187 [Nylanderia fulva]|uniref:uncharacterized protein LOC114943187 n=1 Tax=Nylanderia fulva TaxID=613905 RepID=UPI0010FB0562|nr:uncharacterized protein LOC114943187 [Nylanderia fulva]